MFEGKTLDEIRVSKEAENESDWVAELESSSGANQASQVKQRTRKSLRDLTPCARILSGMENRVTH